MVKGKEVRAEATFTAESTAGTINIFFPDLTFEMAEGETGAFFKFVVFEELYVNVKNADGTVEQHIVSEHKDSRDSKQTLSAGIIVTGDETPLFIFLGLVVLAMAGIGIVLWKK